MSRLPKPSSRLPLFKSTEAPAATTSSSIKPSGLTRRSKSYTDLSSLNAKSKVNFKPLRPIPENKSAATTSTVLGATSSASLLANNKLRRRSKSSCDMKRNAASRKPPAVAQKENKAVGTKRPAAGKPAPDLKPKVAKQAKLPDWDYKGRFNQLNERFNHLREAKEKQQERLDALAGVEQQFEQLTTDLERETARGSELQTQVTANESELKDLRPIKPKYETLVEVHAMADKELKTLKGEHAALVAKEADVSFKLDKITTEHGTLTNAYGRLKLEFDMFSTENRHLQATLEAAQQRNVEYEEEVRVLKERLHEATICRRNLHNTIQDLKGNIRVFARIRPPINAEEEDKVQCRINYVDENGLEIRTSRESVSISGKIVDAKQEFTFDKIFSPDCNQKEVFEELAQLVQSALDGYNVCVFAYGQTGSGKTYTMQGSTTDPEQYGVIPRTIEMVFSAIDKLKAEGWSYKIDASFLEIYNETIRDLLDQRQKTCEIKHHEGKVSVTNLIIQTINSPQELEEHMRTSQRNRAVATTDFNEHSSRSHAVTKIYLECSHAASNATFSGSINLVDLAGSESAKTSDRMTETKSINKSLSTLGTVMLALHSKDGYIPYRNSKLTYLLQSCLGGNSKTLMFVNISPFEEAYSESINSLRFASKVKEVKLASKKNKLVAGNSVGK